MTTYEKRRAAYIIDCLGTEPVKPSGMCGHLYYASIKGRQFDDLLRTTMTAAEFQAYAAPPVSQAKPSSFAEFWRRTSAFDPKTE